MGGLPILHGTSIPVACLVFKKTRNGNSNNILFIDASKEYVPEKPQNTISDEQIDKIYDAYVNRKNIEKFAHVASMDEIIANGYNLNIPRYVDTADEVEEIDLAKVAADIEKIDGEISKVSEDLKASFDQLGLKYPF